LLDFLSFFDENFLIIMVEEEEQEEKRIQFLCANLSEELLTMRDERPKDAQPPGNPITIFLFGSLNAL